MLTPDIEVLLRDAQPRPVDAGARAELFRIDGAEAEIDSHTEDCRPPTAAPPRGRYSRCAGGSKACSAGLWYMPKGGDTLDGIARAVLRANPGIKMTATAYYRNVISKHPANKEFLSSNTGLATRALLPRWDRKTGRGPERSGGGYGMLFCPAIDAPLVSPTGSVEPCLTPLGLGWSVLENAPGSATKVASVLLGQMQDAGGRCAETSSHAPVVGGDDRRPVTDTRRIPFRWICKLYSVYPPDAQGARPVNDGTGFLIDADTIVTVGHNIDHPDTGVPDFVLAIPALNKTAPFDSSKLGGAAAPFGAFVIRRGTGSSRNFLVAPEWHSARSTQHDYGLIRFRKNEQVLQGAALTDGWNTVEVGLADISVANVERQAKRRARPAEIIRLLRLHSGRISVTGYGGDRPCRQLGARGGQTRKFNLADESAHNLMESFLDTTAGNSGSPYWIIKDRHVKGQRSQQHILIGVHDAGVFPFQARDPETTLRVASLMIVITPTVWHRLRNPSLLREL